MYAESTVIYADILFAVNFSLDYLCLFFAGRLLNLPSKGVRLLAAAALGGAYSFFPYLLYVPFPLSVLLALGGALLMCFIAFGRVGPKKFFCAALGFVVFCSLMGGLITAIYSISGKNSDGIYTEATPVGFAAACLVSAGITFVYAALGKRKINARYVRVKIHIGAQKLTASLLADSGNLVTEPFSSLPVIIISAAALPPPFDDPESEFFPLKLRAIPFGTAAGKGCFLGFRPDKIEIVRLGRKSVFADAYIAVDTLKSSYSGYDGIIPASIM